MSHLDLNPLPPPQKKKKNPQKKKERKMNSLPVHLKYDLFAVDGDITTCFHHSFTFLILQRQYDLIVNIMSSAYKL